MSKTQLSLALAASISALGIVIAHDARGPTVEEMQAIIKQYQAELAVIAREEAAREATELRCDVRPAQTARGEAFEQVVCGETALGKEASDEVSRDKLTDGRVAITKEQAGRIDLDFEAAAKAAAPEKP